MTDTILLDGKARLVSVSVHGDTRGSLAALEFGSLPFAAVRMFTIEAPDGAVRGGHAHKRGRQLLMRVSGEIAIELRAGSGVEHIVLGPGSPAVLVEPGVWGTQTYRQDGRLAVLCDTAYDPEDYVA